MAKKQITRYTCDICGCTFDCPDEKPLNIPLMRLALPVKHYNETGEYQKLAVSEVEACWDCLVEMEKHLSQRYEMSNTSYVGVEIKKKEG